MEISESPPTRFDLPGRDPVYIATQRWALEPWEGEDPPSLAKIWSRKPKFAVNGSRSCAELAIVHHLRDDGWRGMWVNSFGPRELRSEWFPAPAAKTLAETGAPDWAVAAFERLKAANGGTLGGFSTCSPGGNQARSGSARRRSARTGSRPHRSGFP